MHTRRNFGIMESHDETSKGNRCMRWDLQKLLNANPSAAAFGQKTIRVAGMKWRLREIREEPLMIASGWKLWDLVAKDYTYKQYTVHLVLMFGYLYPYRVGVCGEYSRTGTSLPPRATVVPSEYHSTNASYSCCIYLTPTLYNQSKWQRQ
jgi:hypothetical protein